MDEVVTVSDDEVVKAMVWSSSARSSWWRARRGGLAGSDDGRVPAPEEGEVCAVLSGGNVDASLLSECNRLGETVARRGSCSRPSCRTVPARSRACSRWSRSTAGTSWTWSTSATAWSCTWGTAIKLVLQTRGPENSDEILEAARAEGFSVRVERDA